MRLMYYSDNSGTQSQKSIPRKQITCKLFASGNGQSNFFFILIFRPMLKTSSLSCALGSIQSILRNSTIPDYQGLRDMIVLLVGSNGELISSAQGNRTTEYCEKIGAVAASLAVEYTAMDSLMSTSFRSYTWSTDRCLVSCSRFCCMRNGGYVLLVLAVPSNGENPSLNALMESLATRLVADMSPFISPLLENMTSAPSENE